MFFSPCFPSRLEHPHERGPRPARTRRRRTLPGFAVGLTLLWAGGCQVYDASLLDAREPDAGAVRDASTDTSAPDSGVPDTGAMDGSCTLGHPPGRPAPPGGTGPDLVFVLRDLVFNQGGGVWQSTGYDLDGLCTRPAMPEVECTSATAIIPAFDGNGGIDNSLGREVSGQLLLADPTFEMDARTTQQEGRATIVLRLRGYNGLDDDDGVFVTIAQSVFGVRATELPPDGGTPDPTRFDGGQPLPAWDGQDRFWVSDRDFVDANQDMPIIRDDRAYVSGRTLVVAIPDRSPLVFPWSGNRIFLALTDAVITGRLNATLTRLDNAVLAGRWGLIDISPALTGAGVCPGSIVRAVLDDLMRRAADVRSMPGTGGVGASCDAISMGLGFTGYQARWGGLFTVPTAPPRCP